MWSLYTMGPSSTNRCTAVHRTRETSPSTERGKRARPQYCDATRSGSPRITSLASLTPLRPVVLRPEDSRYRSCGVQGISPSVMRRPRTVITGLEPEMDLYDPQEALVCCFPCPVLGHGVSGGIAKALTKRWILRDLHDGA